MFNNFNNEKGYVFSHLLLVGVIASLLFVYVGYIFTSFQKVSPQNGVSSTPNVEDATLLSLTLTCNGLGIMDGWCQATKQVSADAAHTYTLLYPKNYTVKEVGSNATDLEFKSETDKVTFSVVVKLWDIPQTEKLSVSELTALIESSEKVMSTKETTIGKNSSRAVELSATSSKGNFIYYIFQVYEDTDAYVYLLKFDSTIDPKVIKEVSSTFSVAVL